MFRGRLFSTVCFQAFVFHRLLTSVCFQTFGFTSVWFQAFVFGRLFSGVWFQTFVFSRTFSLFQSTFRKLWKRFENVSKEFAPKCFRKCSTLANSLGPKGPQKVRGSWRNRRHRIARTPNSSKTCLFVIFGAY